MIKPILAVVIAALVAGYSVFASWQERRKVTSRKYILLYRILGGISLWGGFAIIINGFITPVPGKLSFLSFTGIAQLALGVIFLNMANLCDAINEHNSQPSDKPPSEQ